jgi:hypothetical protein
MRALTLTQPWAGSNRAKLDKHVQTAKAALAIVDDGLVHDFPGRQEFPR